MKETGRSCRSAKHGGGIGWALTAVLAAAIGCAAPQPVAAADLGIRIGSYLGTDADDPVPVIGAWCRWDVPGPLNLEISADYRKETLLGGGLDATVVPLRATAVLNLLTVVSPYLLAGVGADYVGIGLDSQFGGGDEVSIVFEVHAGGGLEVNLGPLSLIGDLRYCSAGSISSDAVQAALGHPYDPSGWSATLSAGFAF